MNTNTQKTTIGAFINNALVQYLDTQHAHLLDLNAPNSIIQANRESHARASDNKMFDDYIPVMGDKQLLDEVVESVTEERTDESVTPKWTFNGKVKCYFGFETLIIETV